MKIYLENVEVKNNIYLEAKELCLNSSKIYTVTGKNGSGKTLFIKKLFTIISEMGYSVGYVDQNNDMLFSKLTVIENIAMSTDAFEIDKTLNFLEDNNFMYLKNLNTNKLSGGEMRIINILRCIYLNPDIIFIDEPTNDLDYELVEKFISLLDKYKNNKIIIMVSHDDRIINNSDEIIKLENKQLIIDKCDKDSSDFSKKTGDKTKQTKQFFNKLFSLNYVSIFLTLLIILFFGIEMKKYSEKDFSLQLMENDNQVNLYIPHSNSLGVELLNTVYPFSITNVIYSNNMIAQISNYNKIKKEKQQQINFCLNLQSTEKYTVYPIEFYDPIEKKFYYTIDYYLSKYHGTNQYEINLDTNDYFIQPYMYAENDDIKFKMDIQKFEKCVNDLNSITTKSGGKLEVTCVVVILKDILFDEFLTIEEIRSLGEENIYIKANDITNYAQNIKKLNDLLSAIIKLSFIIFIVLISNSIYTFFYMYSHKNNFFILKNYNICIENVTDAVKKKITVKTLKLLSCVLLAIFTITCFKENIYKNYMFLFIIQYMLYLSLEYKIKDLIFKELLKKYYRWYAR